MTTADRIVPFLLIASALMFVRAPFMIYDAPAEQVMGVIQKIFYFHVPSAMVAFFGAMVCGGASAAYLWKRRPGADRLAIAGAELAVLFGAIVLVTGPLWARKAWGIWWEWDVRLTMTLVMWMVFVSYLLLRRFGGPGSDVMASAVGLFGMALVPFIYVSVNIWRTQHPTTDVVPTLQRPMASVFWWCVGAFVLLFLALLITRVRLERSRAALEEAYVALDD